MYNLIKCYVPFSFHNSVQPLFGEQFLQFLLPYQSLNQNEGDKNQLTVGNRQDQKTIKQKLSNLCLRKLPYLDSKCQFIVATPKIKSQLRID